MRMYVVVYLRINPLLYDYLLRHVHQTVIMNLDGQNDPTALLYQSGNDATLAQLIPGPFNYF